MLRLFAVRLVVFLLILPTAVLAFEVRIVDQNGEPVKDAVVSIAEGTISKDELEKVNSTPAIMDQIQRQFVPRVLAVEKGRNIVFPNSDNIRHHVYSFSKPKSFQIKLYKGVPKKPLSFDNEGIVVLGCNIHDSMIGYVFVSPWPVFSVTPDSGLVEFKTRPKEVAVWHPWVSGLKAPIKVAVAADESNTLLVELEITPPKPPKTIKSKFKKFYKR
mgnify:CR=1 FL=1